MYMQGACVFVAVWLHYFFLASFCWMLCEGIMLYLMLVVVFSKLSEKWWFFLLVGYGECCMLSVMACPGKIVPQLDLCMKSVGTFVSGIKWLFDSAGNYMYNVRESPRLEILLGSFCIYCALLLYFLCRSPSDTSGGYIGCTHSWVWRVYWRHSKLVSKLDC